VYRVDPIDGTVSDGMRLSWFAFIHLSDVIVILLIQTNFVHNYPFVAVSIGFIQGGIPRVGVVYNPFTDCLYEAAEGSGTFMNGKPVRIDTDATSIQDCLLVNNIGHLRSDDFIEESSGRIQKWLKAGLRGFRASGSAAQNLAHVASGQVSCYYEHGYGGPWDVAAGIVLVREAGGVVWDARESEQDLTMRFGKGSVCAGSRRVVEDVLRIAGKPTFRL
jgi:inositol-phosphate phosphatase/L-galactose 1-phosphate phosphatase